MFVVKQPRTTHTHDSWALSHLYFLPQKYTTTQPSVAMRVNPKPQGWHEGRHYNSYWQRQNAYYYYRAHEFFSHALSPLVDCPGVSTNERARCERHTCKARARATYARTLI